VQLTLSQQAALTGAIIVTTPQKVALNVARKGLQMFEQVSVPILGIVENMSGFTCAHCGETTQVFHSGGGSLLAAEAGVPFLSAIPLDPAVMMSGDDGIPVAERDGNGSAGQAFTELARNLISALADTEQSRGAGLPDSFGVNGTGELEVDWKDAGVAQYAPRDLRISCACALCVDEDTGKRTLDPARVPLEISITSVKPVGRYGLSIAFSDGHDSGIYTFERLRKLSETKQQSFKL
jgi:ATP-binding protein involved in chromosome partitioning